MCGMVKPPRVECGPMHCRLPGQPISEVHEHSAICQVGGHCHVVSAAEYAERGFHSRAGAIEPTTTPAQSYAGTGRHCPIIGMLHAGILRKARKRR